MENVPEGLLLREAARKEAAAVKREQRESEGNANENVGVFFRELALGIARIKSVLKETRTMDHGSLEGCFAGLVDETRLLQASVTRAASFLSAYDVQKAQKDTAALEQTVRGYKARLIPRQPFSFAAARARQPEFNESTNNDADDSDNEMTAVAVSQGQQQSGQTIVLRELASNFVHFENYSDSSLRVESEESPLALKLSHLEDCTVFAVPIRGSVFVEHCHRCIFQISSAQLRIHDSKDCRFEISTHSDPIIEDSQTLVFSPNYPAGNDASFVNRWNQVRDFNCPIAGASRNFILEKSLEK